MRIYNREEFLKLPAGTLYIKATEPWAWEEYLVKVETLNAGDWVYADIRTYLEGKDLDYSWEYMLQGKLSCNSRLEYQRDGCFDDNELFMVFEKPDLELLKNVVNKCIHVSEGGKWEDEEQA
jgi:hypothetical protein